MKKIFTLLALMAMFVGVTSAQQRTLTMQNGGTMYKVDGSSTTGLGTKWVFSGTPEVTITGKKTDKSADIMNRGNTYFIADPVSDFNIALPDGYIIKSFSLKNIKNDNNSDGTVNFICGAQQQALTSTAQTITVSNVNAQTVDFTLSGPSDKSWLRCPIQQITIDYQPLHIIYNCYDENDAFLERVTSTELYKNGTTVDVSGFTHNIPGYVQQSITPTSVTINGADAEVKVVYAASSQTTTYNNIIAALKAVNWGLTSAGNHGKVGYYNFTSNASGGIYAYAGNEIEFLKMLEAQGYSAERLQVVQSLNVPGAYALNMPATNKFYRFHIGNDYMCNVAGSDNVRTVTTTNNDKSTIFYLDNNSYLVAYADGYGFNYGYCKPTATGIFNSFDFSESTTAGYYTIHSNAGTETNQWSDRYLTIDGNNSKLAEGQGAWTIEEVTELPVTITAAGWATAYFPVAVTIPTNVKAYRGTINNGYVHLDEIDGTIPANCAVVLSGDADTYNFEVTTTDETAESNDFKGDVATFVIPSTDTYYTLRADSDGSNPGFFTKEAGKNIQGFRAYLKVDGASQVRALMFHEITGVNIPVELIQSENAYDLQGRRVQTPDRGLYIINGKKVIF